ncbi:MAG: O-antigen ligase family protein [Bacteroidales bacterium]|jgi:O-antigen ligase|nr:O-antigen ligase family protein [Bacteroidales bacterium]
MKITSFFHRLIYPMLLFCCFAITLHPVFKSLSLLLLFITLVGSLEIKKVKLKQKFWSFYNPYTILLSLYLLYCIGIFHTTNLQYGLEDLQIKLPLFILPFLMLFVPKELLVKEKLWHYAVAFILGLVMIMIYLVIAGFTKAIAGETFEIRHLHYSALSGKLGVTPAYMALAITVSIMLLCKMPLVNIFKIKPLWSRIIKACALGFLTLFLLFLRSRAGLLCFAVVNITILIDDIMHKKMYLLLLSLIYIVTVIVAVVNISVLNSRYKVANDSNTTKSVKIAGSTMERQAIYTQYPKLFLSNLPFGVGTGDTKTEITNLAKQEGIGLGLYLNAHNQFLQTGIAIGTPGLAALLWLHLLFVIKFWNKRQWWLISLIAISGISMMFESMLERQQGVHYFVFLICFLAPLVTKGKTNYSEGSSALSTEE